MTSEGFIPHIVINNHQAPVMIDTKGIKVDEYYAPLRMDGDNLSYALPGGKYFSEKPKKA